MNCEGDHEHQAGSYSQNGRQQSAGLEIGKTKTFFLNRLLIRPSLVFVESGDRKESMLAIWATLIKELTELRRDRAGLLVLLVMPMALLIIISLVQDSVMKATGVAPVRLLLVDLDHGFLGTDLTRQLQTTGGVETVTRIGRREVDEETARKAVLRGDFQVCLVIPAGTSDTLRKKIGQLTEATWTTGGADGKLGDKPALAGIVLYFDPAAQGLLHTAVANALHRVFLGIEARERAAAMTKTAPGEIKKLMNRMLAKVTRSLPAAYRVEPAIPEIIFSQESNPLLDIAEQSAAGKLIQWPTAAQQNVPGWALFGMFFIVVPLSGVLVRERQSGTFHRLMTMPVSPAALLAGKVGAYLIVCSAQFALMLAAGCYVLPFLGVAGLETGVKLLAVVPIVIAASLAATGFGLLVGTLAKTYEQASMFGAVAIVIAAAIGGVMVPTYVMPQMMQKISVISPLAWGLTAFQDIFVRGGSLRTVLPELAYLVIFFTAAATISGFSLRGSRRP